MALRLKVLSGHMKECAVFIYREVLTMKPPHNIEISVAPADLVDEHRALFTPECLEFIASLAIHFRKDISQV